MIKMRVSQPSVKMQVSSPSVHMEIKPTKVVRVGGTTDHRELENRDADNQHPIKAITGLGDELKKIPPAVERITNTEIEGMLT